MANDTHNDPPEARQLRQWQSAAVVGKDDLSMDIFMEPQLQAPRILSEADAILRICSRDKSYNWN